MIAQGEATLVKSVADSPDVEEPLSLKTQRLELIETNPDIR